MSNAELEALEVGSVVRTPTGYRVVRAVTHMGRSKWGSGNPQGYATFTIERRSWTGRPYTVVGFNDLRQRKYQATTATVSLDDPLSKALARDLRVRAIERLKLKPEDVRGIP